MKNKYLVIKANGELVEPEIFLSSKECEHEFRLVIEREALGIKAKESNDRPKYLRYANKFGFDWEDNSSPGFIQYNHKADLMMRLVKEYARKLVNEIGLPIYEVKGANFFDLDYPVVQAYAKLFGDRLFIHNNDDKKLVMSYDASYPQFNLARKSSINSNAMPFAHFSISDCYRYEQSGECMLLFRGRRFFMPDLHPYLRDLNEAWKWYFKLNEKLVESFDSADRKFWNNIKVSSEKNWEKFSGHIKEIVKRGNKPALVEIRCDKVDRYWIIDVDYSIVDNLNQVREIGCIQIDAGNAKRLGIMYFDKSGKRKFPVIIHAAIPGGIERYLYMVFDNFKAGFPLWFYPVQVRLLLVGEDQKKAAMNFIQKISDLNLKLRIEIDDRAESVSKKIKLAHEDLIPNYFVFGQKEAADSSDIMDKLIGLDKEVRNFPFIQFSWPRELSHQIKQK